MGLDTTHNAWHGGYISFNRWRVALAAAAGYRTTAHGYALDWHRITDANVRGEWDATPVDPLLVLLAHSDCDGAIHPAQAGPLADRIAELLPLLPEGSGGGHIGDWQDKTQTFIDGLQRAADAGEDVDFR